MRLNASLPALGAALAASLVSLTSHAAVSEADEALIQKGEYLARAADCSACHRPPEETDKPFAGGYVIASPMGDIVASNITPSHEYGIGDYSEAQFKRALTEGIRADGAHLYPAMPYTAYSGLTDDDIHALYVYFMHGVEPVDEPTPETSLPFPFNLRFSMAAWNFLFLDDAYTYDPEQSEALNYGRYLVDTLGHCGSCHTPRNALMGESSDRYLSGANVGGWYAPNITSDASGIGSWSEDELVQYLRTGHVENRAQAGGGMAEAIEHSLRHLSDDDLHSMAAYLKQVPPTATGPAIDVSQAPHEVEPVSLATLEPLRSDDTQAMVDADSIDGQTLYNAACASCHQVDGQGTEDQFYPSLIHNTATQGVNADNLIMSVLQGVHRETNDYTVAMPAFGEQLSDEQIAAVSNYVLSQYGNPELEVDAARVTELRQGGPTPLLVKAMPWLIAAGVIFVLFVLGMITFLIRGKKR
ncbi:c-type cytochrome [Halomonas sp.]|uniref:c-type cytochrome n=1 Tax=Halomonas sp. TaxID=1486246 RepID=UPI003A9110DB